MDASLLFGSAGGGIAMFYAAPEYVCGFCCSLKLCFAKGGAEYTRVSIPTRYRRIKQTASATSGYSCGLHNNKDDGA
jgi:hypothetical protein